VLVNYYYQEHLFGRSGISFEDRHSRDRVSVIQHAHTRSCMYKYMHISVEIDLAIDMGIDMDRDMDIDLAIRVIDIDIG
jgi:hypothetical protein